MHGEQREDKPLLSLIDLVMVWIIMTTNKLKNLGVCKFESITRTLEKDCFISSLRPGLFHTSRCGDFQELLASLLRWGFQWPLTRLPAMVNALQASPKCEFTLTSPVDRQLRHAIPQFLFIVVVPLIAHGPLCGQGLDYVFSRSGLANILPCFRGERIKVLM
jgi:hypothetical protein